MKVSVPYIGSSDCKYEKGFQKPHRHVWKLVPLSNGHFGEIVQILFKGWVLVTPTPFSDHYVLYLDHGDMMNVLVLLASP